ncbi:MAG TPA: GNAT family N-acetyltransferase [Thermomicrobiales bacterium]|nr:GNAT family N-acetyltransferase [Thermomicrobiales bacterium]
MASAVELRGLESLSDLDVLGNMHRTAAIVDRVDPVSARERIPDANELARVFPLDRTIGNPDFILAIVNDEIVGYVHVLWRWNEAQGVRVYLHLGLVHPEWRGQGIGRLLVQKARERIRELAREDDAESSAVIATNVSSTEARAKRLMDSEGYAVVRSLSDMAARPVPIQRDRPLASGIRISELGAEDARAAYAAWKDAYSDSPLATEESEADFDGFRHPWFDGSGSFRVLGAVYGGEVAGLVVSQQRNGVGVIHEVVVRKAYRRRGIASALLIDSLNALIDAGVTQNRLFTDADNGSGARSLYESLGFREVKRHFLCRRPVDDAEAG